MPDERPGDPAPDTVRLRNGSVLAIQPLDEAGLRLCFEAMAAGNAETAQEAVRKMLPEASAADVLCLASFPDDLAAITRRAIAQLRATVAPLTFTPTPRTGPWPS